jgi:hypothetical protein
MAPFRKVALEIFSLNGAAARTMRAGVMLHQGMSSNYKSPRRAARFFTGGFQWPERSSTTLASTYISRLSFLTAATITPIKTKLLRITSRNTFIYQRDDDGVT